MSMFLVEPSSEPAKYGAKFRICKENALNACEIAGCWGIQIAEVKTHSGTKLFVCEDDYKFMLQHEQLDDCRLLCADL